MSIIVTAKGEVTIPQDVLDQLGIGPGSKVDLRGSAGMQGPCQAPTRSWT